MAELATRRTRSSRRGSILLGHLPDTVRSQILADFIGQEGVHHRGSMKTLTHLGSTSKDWSRWVYRETPGLWRKIGNPCMAMASMTDKQLAALLRRINAKEVVKEIDLSYCFRVSGTGLEPLRGSTVLRRANLRCGSAGFKPFKKSLEALYEKQRVDPDLKALVSIVESMPPFSTTASSAPELLKVSLPRVSSGGKKRWNGYKEALLGLHRMYRKNHRNNPLPCPTCDNPSMQFWMNSSGLSEIFIKTYCTKCHREDDEDPDFDEEDKKYFEENPDTGILSCCNKDCKEEFVFPDSITCATCHYPWEAMTCCSGCHQSGKVLMDMCSVCNTAMCDGCKNIDYHLEELAVRKCDSCEVMACGVCKKKSHCESYDCSVFGPDKWYCSDCDILKPCGKCGTKLCEKERCRTAECNGCGDAFCRRNRYDDCSRELGSCDLCSRSFCRKKECPSIQKCRGCNTSACDLCISDGNAETIKCGHCLLTFCRKFGCIKRCNMPGCGKAVCNRCIVRGVHDRGGNCSRWGQP